MTFSCLLLRAQKTEPIVGGVILSLEDSTPILNVHIINLNLKLGVVSQENGKFTIRMENTDTLQISIVGFKTQKISSSQFEPILYLEKHHFDIETFTVLPYKDFEEFKTAFTNLKIEDKGPKINPSVSALNKSDKKYSRFKPIPFGVSYSGGISSLLGHYNKHVKDKANYYKLIRKDKYEAKLAKKFNPELIKRATSLKNDVAIEIFMEFCDFSNRFIELSSEYELTIQIIDCYEEFYSLQTSK